MNKLILVLIIIFQYQLVSAGTSVDCGYLYGAVEFNETTVNTLRDIKDKLADKKSDMKTDADAAERYDDDIAAEAYRNDVERVKKVLDKIKKKINKYKKALASAEGEYADRCTTTHIPNPEVADAVTDNLPVDDYDDWLEVVNK